MGEVARYALSVEDSLEIRRRSSQASVSQLLLRVRQQFVLYNLSSSDEPKIVTGRVTFKQSIFFLIQLSTVGSD